MEAEKQQKAAEQQPETEVLAGEQPTVEVRTELPETPELTSDGTPAAEGEAAEAQSSADAGEQVAPDAVDEDIDSTGSEDEPPVQDTAADGGAPDTPSTSESEEDEAAEFEHEFLEGAPVPDAGEDGSEADSESSEPSPETSISAFELIGSTEEQATAAETDAATLKAVLEAIVYVLPEPVPAAQMAAALNQPLERVESILRELMEETANPERGVFIREVAGGYQVATKPEHHEAIRNFVKNLKQPLKLSNAALETLAVIAYKQPVTAPEIMDIRGVQGVGVLKTLLDRKLITTAGRKNVIGKPILYKTTKEFLTQFGLNRISELPTLKEFEEIRRQSISDDEIEERPEAHPSAPLLEQAGALDELEAKTDETPDAEPSQDQAEANVRSETVTESEPQADGDSQPAEPSEPESEPESEENHG